TAWRPPTTMSSELDHTREALTPAGSKGRAWSAKASGAPSPAAVWRATAASSGRAMTMSVLAQISDSTTRREVSMGSGPLDGRVPAAPGHNSIRGWGGTAGRGGSAFGVVVEVVDVVGAVEVVVNSGRADTVGRGTIGSSAAAEQAPTRTRRNRA